MSGGNLSVETTPIIEFGRYKILPYRRELLADDRPVELGARAFDVLMALVEAGGNILSKDDLISQAWPGRVVEENSLQVQISALRKAFSADRDLIRTVAGRGYYFAGLIRPATENSTSPYSPNNLPEPISKLICRDEVIVEVSDLVRAHRLVTLTGTGGIGKTRLGIEIARQMHPSFADGVFIVELASIADPEFVSNTVATTLGLSLSGGELTFERIAKAIGSRQLLLMLDNCEHVIDAVACLAETLVRASPNVYVMATSREPLRAEGETIYQIPPLDVPTEGTADMEELLQAGAVRLFLTRVRSSDQHFAADLRVVSTIGDICRRLDGIPLAIELAAAGVVTFGVDEVAARLHDRFRLLTGGRRTAMPRHQTLRATLDWSYELLPEPERLVLRRLAIFAGSFTLETASAVVSDSETSSCEVVACVANLVAKSLVMSEAAEGKSCHRLLETTGAYALERLKESGEFEILARRHAEYFRDIFERAESERETYSSSQWLAEHRHRIGNVRVALDWAFSPDGDTGIGVALAASSTPLWFQLSLFGECVTRINRVLSSISQEENRTHRYDMKLFTALGGALMYTQGPGPAKTVWIKAFEIAENLGDVDYQLRALWGLCVTSIICGENRSGMAFAERFANIAANSAEPADALVGERMVGVSLHILGEQDKARKHLDRMLRAYPPSMRRSHIVRFQYDQPVAARAFLARTLWLQGLPDQAMQMAQQSVDEARDIDHVLTLCHALAQAACPLALRTGDLDAAENFIAMLLDYSRRHSLSIWHTWGEALQGVLLMKRGHLAAGVQQLRSALNDHRETKMTLYDNVFLGILADGLAALHQPDDGLEKIDEALARSEHDQELWCMPELLRVKGDLLLAGQTPDPAAAEEYFLRAMALAREQGALSWELRAATSLAGLCRQQNKRSEGLDFLRPVYAQFTEGFATPDLLAARSLLAASK